MFETTVTEGVLRVRRPGARWLSTGWRGGEWAGDAAYNVSVPAGWTADAIEDYLAERLARAGFADDGPALFTAIDLRHARGARLGPVEVVTTAGLSNPASLPLDPDGQDRARDPGAFSPGTVNVVVGTTRSLAPGALANLVAVAAETKAATLLETTGFTGTTTDAVVAAADPEGEPAPFSGSATPVGDAARACVRDSLLAALRARYGDRGPPPSVDDAEYGVVCDRRATVFRPELDAERGSEPGSERR